MKLTSSYRVFLFSGIMDNPADSLFTYAPGRNWSDFYDPNFSPMFLPTFDDPALEKEATSICGSDVFCLFDIAATKRVEIGVATMEGGEDFDNLVDMSVPSEWNSFGHATLQKCCLYLCGWVSLATCDLCTMTHTKVSHDKMSLPCLHYYMLSKIS